MADPGGLVEAASAAVVGGLAAAGAVRASLKRRREREDYDDALDELARRHWEEFQGILRDRRRHRG